MLISKKDTTLQAMNNYSDLGDKELVKKSQQNDPKAFEEIVSRDSEYIWNWINQRTKGDNFLAEDLFQMTLIKCWKNIKKFKCNAAFKTWACAIARNLFIDDYRRKGRRKEVSLDAQWHEGTYVDSVGELQRVLGAVTEVDPLKKMRNEDLKIFLSQIMNGLSHEHKSVLHYFAVEELSYEEISKAMNCSVGTVMSRLFYARKKAQSLIKRHGDRNCYVG